MQETRVKRAKLNILFSLISQAIIAFFGLVVSRLLLKQFGSELYGATASITQFLSYIALLEGGVGGVGRAALYEPLANNDKSKLEQVLKEIDVFFKRVALISLLYICVLAISFKFIAHFNSVSLLFSACLVIVISLSTLAQYYFGLTNLILLRADQRLYIFNIIDIFTTIINAIFVVVLIKLNANIIVVKLFSSIAFIIKPICLYLIVKKEYSIDLKKVVLGSDRALTQKWTGLGQHIAFFLHSNTDIVVLTIFTDLKTVAVYSIYNMVISKVQSLVDAFASGTEAVFGDIYARKEIDHLQNVFGYYDTMISTVSSIVFSTALVLILPFVKLYTANVNDANYIQPVFAVLIIVSALLYCWRIPYHHITIAANQFKQTRAAAYGEAAINISLSIILVIKFGLIGVILATVIAVLFRFVYYAVFISKNILFRPILWFVKREAVNAVSVLIVALVGSKILNFFNVTNFFNWVIAAFPIFALAVVFVGGANFLFYKDDCVSLLKKLFNK